MFSRKTRAQVRTIWRWMVNIWRALILGKDHVLPFVNVFHPTHHCDANCRGCSQKERMKDGNHEDSSLEQLRIILLRMFKISPALYITGGEPTMHKELIAVLKMADEIGFWPISVNSNGLGNRLPEVLCYADRTILSLHSVSANGQARLLGVNPKSVQRILENLRTFNRLALKHGNTLSVNCVLSTLNVHLAEDVLKLCLKNHIPLAIVPLIMDYSPEISRASEGYRVGYVSFVNKVIQAKRKAPKLIVNTFRYLEQIKELRSFRCRPSCIMTVNPDGTVQNPCPVKYVYPGELLGSLLEEDALPILQRTLDFEHSFWGCEFNCCKTCYAEPALSLAHPLSAIRAFVR